MKDSFASLGMTILIALALLTGCKGKTTLEMDPALYESEQVSLMVKGSKVFTFSEGDGQLAFNRTLKQFRAGNDDMSSYFVITCSDLPRQEGQELKADIQWKSGNPVKTTSGITLKVEKMDGAGLVWLWNATNKTGAVVRILNQ